MKTWFITKLTAGQTVIRRLIAKFALSDTPAGALETQLSLLPLVFLTSNIDDLLKTSNTKVVTGISSVAAGWKTVGTVPAGKRWFLHVMTAKRTTGSATKCYGMAVVSATNYEISFYGNVAGDTNIAYTLPHPLRLEPTWMLQIYVDAEAGSDWESRLLYDEEDAY